MRELSVSFVERLFFRQMKQVTLPREETSAPFPANIRQLLDELQWRR